MKKILSVFMTVIITIASFAAPVSAAEVKLDKPVISKAVAKSESSVKLYWGEVEGADKYVIYYSTEKTGSYKKYGVTAKKNVTVKNLEENTTYYFRVKARVTVDGKKYYSAFSSAKKCTTEKAEYEGLKVTALTKTVNNNDYATITIQGKPNTEYKCAVQYTTKWSTAEGLGKKTSDESGKVTWTWKVGAKTKAGEHKIKITGGDEELITTFETVR